MNFCRSETDSTLPLAIDRVNCLTPPERPLVNLTMLNLFLLFLGVHANELLPNESIRMDPHTVLVLWGTRHGNRQPEVFLDENPRTWGFEGTTELTTFGKRQAYGLGRELRIFTGYNKVNTNYNRDQVKYYSSSASRCQMTLQVALAGFHEPVDWADWNQARHDFWSPVPYSIDDPLLRMYSVKECPESDNVWRPISQDTLPELQQKSQESVALRQYCGEKTGWNMTNLGYMADLADNLIEIDLYQARYPAWIERPALPGYNSARMKKEILSFAEIHQNQCAYYAPCGDLMGGYWLQNLLDSIKTAQEGKGPFVIGYASHTEVTLSVMRLMGIDKDELTTSAGFVLEFRMLPTPGVRLLNHDPNPIDRHVIYQAKYVERLAEKQDSDGFIPLEEFVSHASVKAILDWKKVCKTVSDCSSKSSGTKCNFLTWMTVLYISARV